jgi:hypothetical protein
MEHGNLYSLIPLTDFKAVLGIDDREDALSRYCLITATYTIEQYCKRRLLRKKQFEFLPFYGDYLFPLRDYPVREILVVYQTYALKEAIIVEPELYHTVPECGELEDIDKKYAWSCKKTTGYSLYLFQKDTNCTLLSVIPSLL